MLPGPGDLELLHHVWWFTSEQFVEGKFETRLSGSQDDQKDKWEVVGAWAEIARVELF